MNWVIKQHAVERYIDRVEPGTDFGRARAAIERAASSAARMSERTAHGDEKWRAGGDGKAPPIVLVVEAGTQNVVTVLAGKEANMQNHKAWNEVLNAQMGRENITAADLAKRCGVEARAVEAWLAGERAPSGSALPRLYGALPQMRAFQMHLVVLRKQLRADGEPLSEDGPTVKMVGPIEPTAQPLVKLERDTRPAAVAAEMPRHDDAPSALTFGDALRVARRAEALSQQEVAGLLGVCGQSVLRWELGRLSPDTAALAELRKLFPALAGVEPSAASRSKGPRGKAGAWRSAKDRAGDVKRSVSAVDPVRAGTFGEAMRDARTSARLSQGALARLVDVCQGTVSLWEHGKADPSEAAMARLRAALPSLRWPEASPEPLAPSARTAKVEAAQAVVRERHAGAFASLAEADKAPAEAPIRQWLRCVKAVRGAAYRAELVELLRLASDAGLELGDVVDAVA